MRGDPHEGLGFAYVADEEVPSMSRRICRRGGRIPLSSADITIRDGRSWGLPRRDAGQIGGETVEIVFVLPIFGDAVATSCGSCFFA